MRKSYVVLSLTALCSVAWAGSLGDSPRPYLDTRHGARQLIVDGKPFLILGGELHNSSSSSLAYMKTLWPVLVEKKLNTVLAAVPWESIEPTEGKFDFTLVDGLLQEARQNQMRLVFLWFGSWKNGVSSYPPMWVKTDPKRFPLVKDKSGKTLNVLSTFGTATRVADAKAFAALLRHLREVDGQAHTVLMMQVENEVGVLGDSRDHSPAAEEAFAGPVPKELMTYLQQHQDALFPEFLETWKANGLKTSGSWAEVFGESNSNSPATITHPRAAEAGGIHWAPDSVFMAWQYARYVNKVTEAGKAEYDLPMYANAWLAGPTTRPGDYPSGGPVPTVADIWRAGAPRIDFQAPDLYAVQFDEVSANFARNGNPLFVPETRAGLQGATNVFTALFKRNGFGFSPFAIEDRGFGPRGQEAAAAPPADPLADTYAILEYLAPDILNAQGRNMIALLEGTDSNSPPQTVKLGDYTLAITYGSPAGARGSRGGGAATSPATPNASPARFVICAGPSEYVIVGGPMSVTFTPNQPGSGTTQLGSFDEAMYVGGRWVPGRRLNGDETGHNSRWPALRAFGIYRYRVFQRD